MSLQMFPFDLAGAAVGSVRCSNSRFRDGGCPPLVMFSVAGPPQSSGKQLWEGHICHDKLNVYQPVLPILLRHLLADQLSVFLSLEMTITSLDIL